MGNQTESERDGGGVANESSISADQSSAGDSTGRTEQPVDTEGTPRLSFPVIGIGASAGGLEAFIDFFKALPNDTGMAFVLIQHLPPDRESLIADILSKHTEMPVIQVQDNMSVEVNHVYVIRPGRTLTMKNGRLYLGDPLEKPGHRRPVDDFFRSLAEEQRERAVGIIMSGMGSNGTAGAQMLKAVGGICIAQDPDSAKFPSMPRCLIDSGAADFILSPGQMPEMLQNYARHPYASGRSPANPVLRRERQAYTEIITLLRGRSRRDFSGYKQPTVLRRIQRRMGLHQILELDNYAKLVRQNPSEAAALADDLVIHVTGFFRDPDAWESLRQKVIEPLLHDKEQHDVVRVWVTACASGEEAYTLAILLTEAADAARKTLEIKIFATDLADRVLAQARSGIYPQGIEGEMSPERLERFFDKDELTFRVKKELRELIVFSPQNVLQDPPFSRLDICTCRNLLIYLDPKVQHRVLSLLHFALRENGALFLGNSETVNGAEELFEPLDKKNRIYRRVGPTRHGAVEFPLIPSAGSSLGGEMSGRPLPRASMAHLAQRALLDRFTPAAVVVDRAHRVVLFHGDTSPFLTQPPGEPTREVMAMSRESIRGGLRSALQKAVADNLLATSREGFLNRDGQRRRVTITAVPLEKAIASGFFLVSFELAPIDEAVTEVVASSNESTEPPHLMQELHRVRDQLQSAVEELQTSNEELKASNEEVTSVNEELQSTNEELETSKEELQSLNEELTTANTQLQAKMEELEATTNDLSSLLSSTDIAVVFLDTRFRIRRYTAAVRDLFELIPSDLGRPLSDLSPKFADRHLADDARTVLAKLVPIEREIRSESGQWYLRRVLPYRTSDNRIDGVVVTFVDITRRRLAEISQREIEERCRLIVEGVNEYAIFMINLNGRATLWNRGAHNVLGYTEAEALGMDVSVIFTPEDRAAGAPAKELETARILGQSLDERWHLRRNGERFWGSGLVTALKDERGEVTSFVKVMRDHTERKRTEEQLTLARNAAEAANEAKDQFLATVSHELRTPLSVILLWTQMIRQTEIAPEDLREGIAAIDHSATAQKQLIDDLLDTSRISLGKLRLSMRPTDLSELVSLAVETIAPTANAKDLKVALNIVNDVGHVLADPDRIQQILWNLLTNAVKFTPSGGRISVKLSRQLKEVELTVSDTGRGIEAHFLPRVFARFQQSEDVNTRIHGGLGLGLAISKQLVELHGGTITVTSEGLGKGSTFTVRFSAAKITALPSNESKSASSAPNDLNGIQVLLVEDTKDSANALSAILRIAGASVTAVSSGVEALKVLASKRPTVVMTDIAMPSMDGYGLLKEIREAEKLRGQAPVPVVAISAFTREEDHMKAASAGFDDYVAKPIDMPKLIEVLHRVVSGKAKGLKA